MKMSPRNRVTPTSSPHQACLDLAGADCAELAFVEGHDDTILGVAERDGQCVVV